MLSDTLTLEDLEQLARIFDEISDETGARYSAVAFVAWMRAEDNWRREPSGRLVIRRKGPADDKPVRPAA